MNNIRDNLMKPEDIHACFNTQTDIISRLEKTKTKMTELNKTSETKYKRVQKSFKNAAELLKKMQADLWFIHGAIKKLNHLNNTDQAVVDKTTEIVNSNEREIHQIEQSINQSLAQEQTENEQKQEENKNEDVQNELNAEEAKEEDTSQVQVSDSNQENTDNKNENDVKII